MQHLVGKCLQGLKRTVPLKGSIRQVDVRQNQHDYDDPHQSDDDEQRQRVDFERAHRSCAYLACGVREGPWEAALEADYGSMLISIQMSQAILDADIQNATAQKQSCVDICPSAG